MKLFTCIASLGTRLLGSSAAYDIPEDSVLPTAVARFVAEWFPKTTIIEKYTGTKGCIVWLSDGTHLEFDATGEWRRIDNCSRALPEGLVPEPIRRYLAFCYPDAFMVLLERNTGYIVGLDCSVLLLFNDNNILIDALDWKIVLPKIGLCV